MIGKSKSFSVFLLLGLLLAPPAGAQGNEGATIGLYLLESANRPCDVPLRSCEDEGLQLSGEPDLPYYVFLCVFNGDPVKGIAGLECGLEYDSRLISVDRWSRCSSLDFPTSNWPAPGSGNVITWDSAGACQRSEPRPGDGVTALAGYFYMTAYDEADFRIVRRPATGLLQVADCNMAEYETRSEGGSIAFSYDGSREGSLPCRTVVIEDATWSGIKRTQGGSN